jgi:PEP-CTERM motif
MYCGPSVVTFQFGSLTLPDAEAWQVSLVIPGKLYGGGDGLPLAFGGEGITGSLYLPAEGIQLGTVSEITNVVSRIVKPVPEPETWLLMAVGLAGLAARRRWFAPKASSLAAAPAG